MWPVYDVMPPVSCLGECGHWQWAVTPAPEPGIHRSRGRHSSVHRRRSDLSEPEPETRHTEREWQMNKVCCPCFIFCYFWHQACDYTRASEKWTLQLDITWNIFLTAKWQLVINLNKKETNHFLLNLIYPQEQGLKQFNNQSQITHCSAFWFGESECIYLCVYYYNKDIFC